MKHKKVIPFFVTGGCFTRTNSCIPSANQLMVMKKRSGQYTQEFRDQLRVVYLHLNSLIPMTSADLRKTLQSLMPKRCIWSPKDLWNVRLSARRFKKSVACQDAFNKNVLPSLTSILTEHGKDALDNNVDDVLEPSL